MPIALKEKSLLVFFPQNMFKIKKEKIFQNKILRSRDFRHEKKSLQDKCLKSERMYNKNILREMRLPMPTSTY